MLVPHQKLVGQASYCLVILNKALGVAAYLRIGTIIYLKFVYHRGVFIAFLFWYTSLNSSVREVFFGLLVNLYSKFILYVNTKV